MTNTTIQISEETWKKLMQLKSRPSQTFDDLILILFERFKVKRSDEMEAKK